MNFEALQHLFLQLEQKIATHYAAVQNVVIHYLDEEQDWIHLQSQNEWQDIVSAANNSVIKLRVKPIITKTTEAPTILHNIPHTLQEFKAGYDQVQDWIQEHVLHHKIEKTKQQEHLQSTK